MGWPFDKSSALFPRHGERNWSVGLGLFLLFVALYLLPLGQRPMFIPDEMRYAEVPREMLANGDWVVPRLNGVRYFEKPVLGYWLTGASMRFFGEDGFAVRLPSALAAGLTALLIFLFARAGAADRSRVAPLAAAIFLTSFEVYGVGTFAVLDTMLSFFLTLTMFCLYLALAAKPGSGREKVLLAGAGLACGLAFLLKGFLALALPGLVLGGYLVWQGRWRELPRVSVLPALVTILVVLPWGLAVLRREPDFWNFFFWNEHVRRFFSENAQHRQPFWFFLATLPAMFLPWSFTVPAALSGWRGANREGAARDLTRFCLCWLLLPLLFFSACKGKLLTYILPCFPPLALLVAQGLAGSLQNERCRRFPCGAIGAALLFAMMLVVFLGFQLGGIQTQPPYSQTGGWFLVAIGVTLMVLLLLLAARNHRAHLRHICFVLAPLPLFLALQGAVPDRLLTVKAPGAFLEDHRPEISGETILISDDTLLQAVCWVFKRTDVLLLEQGGELDYGLARENGGARLLSVPRAAALIRSHPGEVVLAARRENFARWADTLPPPRHLDDDGADDFILARF